MEYLVKPSYDLDMVEILKRVKDWSAAQKFELLCLVGEMLARQSGEDFQKALQALFEDINDNEETESNKLVSFVGVLFNSVVGENQRQQLLRMQYEAEQQEMKELLSKKGSAIWAPPKEDTYE